jgi:lactate dehydrogenase-like 2-hydroxyacid dehydrogenase
VAPAVCGHANWYKKSTTGVLCSRTNSRVTPKVVHCTGLEGQGASRDAPLKLVMLGGGDRVEEIAGVLVANHSPSELRVVIAEAGDDAAQQELVDADAAYGTLTPELLAAAPKLRWLQCPAAAPVGNYYFPELVASDVVVTNMRGIYDEELSIHTLTLMLGVNRQMDRYHSQQLRHEYVKLPAGGAAGVDIPSATALLVGVGSAGGETARLCKALGMTTIGVDARRTEPHPHVDELYGAESLDEQLPRADFVLSSIPHTPDTEGMFDASKFALMKRSSVFVNVWPHTYQYRPFETLHDVDVDCFAVILHPHPLTHYCHQ